MMTSLIWFLACGIEILATSSDCQKAGTCNSTDGGGADEVSMLQGLRDLRASWKGRTNMMEDLDIPYGSLDKQKVDFYWPGEAFEKPSTGWSAVIILPGSGEGRKGWKWFCVKHIVPTGRFCVAGDYRKTDGDRDDDVFALVQWFHKEAGNRDVDNTKIVLGGVSLGGLSVNNVIWDLKRGKEILGRERPLIRAVMLLSGCSSSHPNRVKKAKYFPESTFICSSDTDFKVPYKHSRKVANELEKKNEHVKFVNIHGAGHSIWWSSSKVEWMNEILSFLDETVPTDSSADDDDVVNSDEDEYTDDSVGDDEVGDDDDTEEGDAEDDDANDDDDADGEYHVEDSPLYNAWAAAHVANVTTTMLDTTTPMTTTMEATTITTTTMAMTTTTTTTTTTSSPPAVESTSIEILDDLDVSYRNDNDRKVDIYWPASDDMLPPLGWHAVIILPDETGSRKDWKNFCTLHIVPSGRLCVAGDYRKDQPKKCQDDVFDLAKWFFDKADRWNVDRSKIVLGGVGLGGISINDVIWDPKKGAKLLQNDPPKLHAVMLLSGTKNGHQRKAKRAKAYPASTFICSSDTDEIYPYTWSKQLNSELTKKGKAVKFVPIPDSGHAIWESASQAEWYNEILLFLDETLT